MYIGPSDIYDVEAKKRYPHLPEAYRRQYAEKDFVSFLKQMLILSGDFDSPHSVSSQGESNGFFIDSACGFDDEEGWGIEAVFVSGNTGAEEHIAELLRRIVTQ